MIKVHEREKFRKSCPHRKVPGKIYGVEGGSQDRMNHSPRQKMVGKDGYQVDLIRVGRRQCSEGQTGDVSEERVKRKPLSRNEC